MTIKHLRYKTCLESDVYQRIVDEAVAMLEHNGVFVFTDVLEKTKLGVIADAIRWDYVRRIIEDRHDTDLYPLGPAYLKRHAKSDETRFPNKFIAGGNGRNTVAYANVSEENAHFVLVRLKRNETMAQAYDKAATRTRAVAERAGLRLAPDSAKAIEAK